MKFRMLWSLAVLSLAASALVGCSAAADSVPSSSPTIATFATEEEAFAAAEETYRAYVDALNQVDLADPSTFEAVYAWTTGELNASDRGTFSELHAEGYALRGKSTITAIDFSRATLRPLELTADVCLLSEGVDIIDASGRSVLPPDRATLQSIQVSFAPSKSSETALIIDFVEPGKAGAEC
ncbi:hypothetical protein [Microbacterium aoyamense]|nr:hypothetical protein [Microbacterium aoyamense]